MNSFDAVITICVIVAMVAGFRSGLLRSLATIMGYVAAMPVAMAGAEPLSHLAGQLRISPIPDWVWFIGLLLVTGIVLGALLRAAVSGMFGPDVSIPDRLAGSGSTRDRSARRSG